MLNKEEFLRLQKLAAISLSDQETVTLGTQLGNIVQFLGKLKDIESPLYDNGTVFHSLKPISGVCEYTDTQILFDNAKHEKIGNSIVVNSVIDN
ncbi:hypothetical protein P148_SR1C00001G0531 [candidate division SR1 bacterium RAAC1_SR1_1]|nr:hypothetical protein P148_SR1C00001G0531 [candidate division SR1 bacterium RAAC1_SR1_1]